MYCLLLSTAPLDRESKATLGGGSSRHTASAGHRDTRGESEADGAVTERAPGGKGDRRVGG